MKAPNGTEKFLGMCENILSRFNNAYAASWYCNARVNVVASMHFQMLSFAAFLSKVNRYLIILR